MKTCERSGLRLGMYDLLIGDNVIVYNRVFYIVNV